MQRCLGPRLCSLSPPLSLPLCLYLPCRSALCPTRACRPPLLQHQVSLPPPPTLPSSPHPSGQPPRRLPLPLLKDTLSPRFPWPNRGHPFPPSLGQPQLPVNHPPQQIHLPLWELFRRLHHPHNKDHSRSSNNNNNNNFPQAGRLLNSYFLEERKEKKKKDSFCTPDFLKQRDPTEKD